MLSNIYKNYYLRRVNKEPYWELRFVKNRDKFDLIEVYIDEKGEIFAWSDSPLTISIKNKSELEHLIKDMRNAYKRPVLTMRKSKMSSSTFTITTCNKLKRGDRLNEK